MSLFKIFKLLTVTIFFIVALLSESNFQLNKINLNIDTSGQKKYIDSIGFINNYFFSQKDIQSYSDINIKLLEDSLNTLDYVYKAEVYLHNDALNIMIEQNNPFIRLGSSFYLNKEGEKIFANSANVSDVLFFSENISDSKFREICELSDYIYKDTFMNSLIKGVDYKKDIGYIFYPRFLDIDIIFGDTSKTYDKFSMIKTFYSDVLSSTRIIDYNGDLNIKSINVKYSNQIICKKIDKSN